MKWVTIEGTHVNTNQIQTFYWDGGELKLWFFGDNQPAVWDDPDRGLYLKLCRQQGIRPDGEERDG